MDAGGSKTQLTVADTIVAEATHAHAVALQKKFYPVSATNHGSSNS